MAAQSFQALLTLEQATGAQWKALSEARESAGQVCRLIEQAAAEPVKQFSSDGSLVVFGSLARGEWTVGSDVDWALLIDGLVVPEHYECSLQIERALSELTFQGQPLIPPGSTGTFGQLVFSHDLVHALGGEPDTNVNTTRRLLLLLESAAIGDASAHSRTIRSVLRRYLLDDVRTKPEEGSRVPRFLVNDIVRFWRTMCVDFGAKHWQQSGKKWGVRNIKLRMSRKLLFVSGLLMALGCDNVRSKDAQIEDEVLGRLIHSAGLPPLEVLASELAFWGLSRQASEIVSVYDEFLLGMNDPARRTALNDVKPQDAASHQVFLEFRKISQRFQKLLTGVFFDAGTRLSELVREYGVF